MQSQP